MHSAVEREIREAEMSRLVAATIYLMTRHACTRCPRMAQAIGQHLEMLAHHPQSDDALGETCRRLHEAWDEIARRDHVAIH